MLAGIGRRPWAFFDELCRPGRKTPRLSRYRSSGSPYIGKQAENLGRIGDGYEYFGALVVLDGVHFRVRAVAVPGQDGHPAIDGAG
jgi:hypothetical protein